MEKMRTLHTQAWLRTPTPHMNTPHTLIQLKVKLHTVALQLPETVIPQPGHTPSRPWSQGSEQRDVTWADQQDSTWIQKNEGSRVLQF